MKELIITLSKIEQPKYLRLAEGIRIAIKDGRLLPGEVLPSSRELAKKFKMNRHTVMNSFSELVSEGWIEAKQKRFYQVVETLPLTFFGSPSQGVRARAYAKKEFELARPLEISEYPSPIKWKHSFRSGMPDIRLFPLKEFKSHMSDALISKESLNYGEPRGDAQLIDQVELYLRRVRGIKDRKIIITNGSQEAIFMIAQLLVGPGDPVGIEALGYTPAIEALRFAGGNLVPIRVDRDGIVVEDLERELKKKKIKLLYLTPLHQYPTTVTLSATRRLQIYELALKYGFFIFEDDYDHEFHYSSQPVAPLASFDPAGIVLYVSTFSKVLFPSARVGFMAVPEPFAREIAKLKRISSRQNVSIIQKAIALWMESGGLERHMRRMRRTYEARFLAFHEKLLELKSVHPEISWQKPDGGMAFWLETGQDSTLLAKRAQAIGVQVYPERDYTLKSGRGTHLRLGFSGQTEEENNRGLSALFSVF